MPPSRLVARSAPLILMLPMLLALRVRSELSCNFGSGAQYTGCNELQELIIQEALTDVSELIGHWTPPTGQTMDLDLSEDAAGLDFFGKQTIERFGSQSILDQYCHVLEGGFNFTCLTKTDDPCTKAEHTIGMHGGIHTKNESASTGNGNLLGLMVCDDFFDLPSLGNRTDIVLNRHPWQHRFNLTEYAENQGSLYLNMDSKKNLDKSRAITNLWLHANVQDDPTSNLTSALPVWGTKLLPCYGVTCARILARLVDARGLSAFNVANYAYAALARHVQKNLQDGYPWFPTLAVADGVTIKDSGKSRIDLAQFSRYDSIVKSNYGDSSFNGSIASKKKDIRNASWSPFPDWTPEIHDNYTKFVQQYSRSIETHAVNFHAQTQLWCAGSDGVDPTKITNGRIMSTFPRDHAESWIQKSCNVLAFSTDMIGPSFGTRNTSSSGKHNKTVYDAFWQDEVNEPRIAVFTDPQQCKSSFIVKDLFEGNDHTTEAANCTGLFLNILDQCNPNSDTPKGGILTINQCVDYTLLAIPGASWDWHVTRNGPVHCAEIDERTRWLLTSEKFIFNEANTCACWREDTPQVFDFFCKPAYKTCVQLGSDLPAYNATDWSSMKGNGSCIRE